MSAVLLLDEPEVCPPPEADVTDAEPDDTDVAVVLPPLLVDAKLIVSEDDVGVELPPLDVLSALNDVEEVVVRLIVSLFVVVRLIVLLPVDVKLIDAVAAPFEYVLNG